MAFRFERLKVWPKALAFADQTIEVSLKWPPTMQSSFGDQVRRAAVSIITNITEASGKRTGGSRRLFYDHAKGSVYEVVGIMTLAKKRELVNDSTYSVFYQAGDEIAAMLWGLMEAEQKREVNRL
jgi:four helix bundle protein